VGPTVTAVIPTYNRVSYLCQAIESALEQGYDNLEVIVVDDGSTDGTRMALAAYEGRIRLIYQEHQGVSAARNTAIAASCGEYVAFLDSDDVWLPGKLVCQMEFLVAHPEVGMVASHAMAIDLRGHPVSDTPLFPSQKEGWVSLETNVLRSPLPVDTLIVRRSCLPKPLPFTRGVGFGEDWEMCLRVGARYPIWFIAKPLAGVRVHEDNVTALLARQKQVDLKLHCRLGVIERVFPVLPGDRETLRLLRAKAEAGEYAEAAVASYANGAFDAATSRLGRAVALDPATWQGEELVALTCNFAKQIFQKRGEGVALAFVEDTLGHLPSEIRERDRLARAVRGRTLIFTVGFGSLAQHDARKAVVYIVQGLAQQPCYVRNTGVLATLARAMIRSVRSR
jgi:hypothetical protein